MKWYEYQKGDERIWWTQRDENGVCYEIRSRWPFSIFKLYCCGEYVDRFGTLQEAIEQAVLEGA